MTEVQFTASQPVPLSAADTPVTVRIQGLTRLFDGRPVLKNLDLAIGASRFVAVLGRSGSGKSTLLRILSGFDREISGRIIAPRRKAIMFQEPRLLPWERVLANVAIGLRDGDARQRALSTLAEVGLKDRARSWPVTLSGGEAQRVALARALVRSPDLLMLDEPFSALDALTRIRMHGLVNELHRRHRPAILLVTHDVDEAILLSDRVLVLKEGRISFDRNVDIPHPRSRTDRAFGDLRRELLEELGVTDAG